MSEDARAKVPRIMEVVEATTSSRLKTFNSSENLARWPDLDIGSSPSNPFADKVVATYRVLKAQEKIRKMRILDAFISFSLALSLTILLLR